MARYEQLVADDEIEARGAAHVDIVAQQERAKKRKLFREKIGRLLWVLVSAFLVWFGDGTGNLGQIMPGHAIVGEQVAQVTLRLGHHQQVRIRCLAL